jgi:cell wall assembly regulator SMI1
MGRRAHQWLELGLAVRRLTSRCNGRRLRAAAERVIVRRTKMIELWSRIRAALNTQAPRSIDALQEGASDLTVARLERIVGGPIPRDLAASFAIHDGQRPPYMSAVLFDNEYLLPCEQVASTWTMRGEVARELGDIEAIEQWWDPVFIPVTDSDGNGFCVHRVDGSVHYHTHDDVMEGPLFLSWRALLEDLATKLERAQFTVEHGSVWLSR